MLVRWNTPVRTLSISGLKSRVMKVPFLTLKMMLKSGLEFILKLTEPLQRYLLSCLANSANLGRYFCTGQQQHWRDSVNYKINSRPLSTIIFKLNIGNFMTRDFSPLIKWDLAGVYLGGVHSITFILSGCSSALPCNQIVHWPVYKVERKKFKKQSYV